MCLAVLTGENDACRSEVVIMGRWISTVGTNETLTPRYTARLADGAAKRLLKRLKWMVVVSVLRLPLLPQGLALLNESYFNAGTITIPRSQFVNIVPFHLRVRSPNAIQPFLCDLVFFRGLFQGFRNVCFCSPVVQNNRSVWTSTYFFLVRLSPLFLSSDNNSSHN
jgi:hypothetical protein